MTGFSDSDVARLYTDYYPRRDYAVESHRVPSEEKGLGAWLSGSRASVFRWVPSNVRVLDIGCGSCERLGYHAGRGCDAYGTEVDAHTRRIAEHFGYRVRVGPFNPDDYQKEFFDYVTMDQVIEHIPDPTKLLHDVARVLKRRGVVILSTPNANGWGAKVFGRRWIHWHAPYHVNFFSNRSMARVAKDAGLHVEESLTITSSAWLHFQ